LANKIIPGGKSHNIIHNTCEDRDVHNLLDVFPTHLKFTEDEEKLGKNTIIAMGIPINAKYICLNVRDSAYLAGSQWDYHSYRDSDIKNYILASETLAERGFYVIRMGAKVHSAIESKNPRIIDYANNGMRNDFMDIYLGAKCFFCITSGSGWDALPENFRRPVVFVNFVPIAGIHTYRDVLLTISKKHFLKSIQQEMTLQEIFATGACSFSRTHEYESNGIELIENTPEEIRDVVIEMADRLEGNFSQDSKDVELQHRFWELFSKGIEMKNSTKVLHGEIRGRFGSSFLRHNQDWLK
jgi:putative glycosyltransferase (TIGR04372 family)